MQVRMYKDKHMNKRINKRMDECMDLDKRMDKHMDMDKCAWMAREETQLPEDFHGRDKRRAQ